MLGGNKSERPDISQAQKYSEKQLADTIALPVFLGKLALALAGNLLEKVTRLFKGKNKQSSLGDNVTDALLKRGTRHRGGNFARALSRSLGRGQKVAQTANIVGKGARVAQAANAMGKGAKAFQAIKTANAMRKVATLGKIGMTVARGASLTNPVGIAVFAGTMLAPIAIEKIFSKGKQIYDAKQDENGLEVSKSELNPDLAKQIAQAKQTAPGQQTDFGELEIAGKGGKPMFLSSENGTVLINEFSPEQELNFFQQGEMGNLDLVFEENQSLVESVLDQDNPQQNVEADLPQQTMEFPNEETVDSASFLQGILKATGRNPEEQELTSQLAAGIDNAQTQTREKIGFKEALFQQNAADSIFRLFQERNLDSSSNKLETQAYDIERQGRHYTMTDKEGNLLMSFSKNVTGLDIQQFNLNSAQKTDLSILKDDLQTSQPLSGKFQLQTDREPKNPDLDKLFMGLNPKSILDNYRLNRINSQDFSINDRQGNLVYGEINGEVFSNNKLDPQQAQAVKTTLLEDETTRKKEQNTTQNQKNKSSDSLEIG